MSHEPLIPVPTTALLPTAPDHAASRRRLLALALSAGAVSLLTPLQFARAQDKRTLTPTPDQILGPFYPVIKPDDGHNDLTQLPHRGGTARGPHIMVEGRVLNRKAEPVRNARLEVWQANAAGRYVHPSDRGPGAMDPYFDGYASLRTDAEGRYQFRTVRPGAYPVSDSWTRPPHIHFDVRGGVNRLVTQMYFSDEDTLNAADKLLQNSWSRQSLIAAVQPAEAGSGLTARVTWDIVLLHG